jgi:hypothetical protein
MKNFQKVQKYLVFLIFKNSRLISKKVINKNFGIILYLFKCKIKNHFGHEKLSKSPKIYQITFLEINPKF